MATVEGHQYLCLQKYLVHLVELHLIQVAELNLLRFVELHQCHSASLRCFAGQRWIGSAVLTVMASTERRSVVQEYSNLMVQPQLSASVSLQQCSKLGSAWKLVWKPELKVLWKAEPMALWKVKQLEL